MSIVDPNWKEMREKELAKRNVNLPRVQQRPNPKKFLRKNLGHVGMSSDFREPDIDLNGTVDSSDALPAGRSHIFEKTLPKISGFHSRYDKGSKRVPKSLQNSGRNQFTQSFDPFSDDYPRRDGTLPNIEEAGSDYQQKFSTPGESRNSRDFPGYRKIEYKHQLERDWVFQTQMDHALE